MRTKYSIKNFITQLITNIISIIFLFIGQTLFIKILGIEYNGLNGLFTNILAILNLFELGIGHSITYHLYKYVKSNDIETIKSIMNYYKKTYRYIAIAILSIGLLITPFLPFIVKEVNVDINIYFSYILFLLTTVATYVLSYKRNIIIANQKNYIINIINIIYIIVLNIIQIIILYFTKNYYLYLAIKIICILIENMIINLTSNILYPYLKDKNVKPIKKEIKNNIIDKVKALVIHKTSGAVTNGTDNILISAFYGLTTTGLYMSYNYIISSVKKIFGNIISASTSSIGNLLIENNKEKSYQIFKKIRYLNFGISVFTATSILILSENFITLWLGKDYLLETSILIVLTLNYYQAMMRTAFSTFKDAAGIWVEDRIVPIFQLTINIVSSIILLNIFGLIGIFLGTIVSSFVLWFYSYPKFIYKGLFNKSYKDYYKELAIEFLTFILIVLVSYGLANMIVFDSLIITFIIKILFVIIVPNALFILLNNKEYIKYYINLIKKI